MTAQAQSDGIPQDSAPRRSLSIGRVAAALLFICGVIVCGIVSQPGQEASVQEAGRSMTSEMLKESEIHAEQVKEDPLLTTVKNIRANRRLQAVPSWFEDEEDLEEQVVTSRRLKGKGKGKGGGYGRGYSRSGSKGSKSKSKGNSGRSIRDTFSPFPTQTPFPTATPFPTSTPFPTFTPVPTWTPFPTWTPWPTMTKMPGGDTTTAPTPPEGSPTVASAPTTGPGGTTTAPTVTGATTAPTGGTTTAPTTGTTTAPTTATA